MSSVLVSGKLFRAPQRKISQSSNPFTIATVREGQGDTTAWWKILAFSDAADELASLGDGEALAVSGLLKVETYEKNGETKISLSVLADRIISAHKKKKQKENRQETEPASNAHPSTFDDEIPF